MQEAPGALALVILLDQFPRNAFRASQRMYATDAKAREVSLAAIESGFDAHMTKPVDLRKLSALVDDLMARKRG